MTRTILALPLAIVTAAALLAAPAHAQDSKKMRGKVTAMTGTSVTIDNAGKASNFTIDAKTKVEAPGAGTATRAAEAAGKPGVKLADVIKTGDAVEVTYTEAAGKMQASMIRKVSSVGSTDDPSDDTHHADGKVTAITANSLSIGAQTFMIDSNTDVIGRGAGTAAAKAGGKVPLTTLVGVGDTVTVSYHETAGKMQASKIRVTMKASK
jgi:hypothetical protein